MEKCEFCKKFFKTMKGLRRHLSTVHKSGGFTCESCQVVFSRKDNLRRHQQKFCKKSTKENEKQKKEHSDKKSTKENEKQKKEHSASEKPIDLLTYLTNE